MAIQASDTVTILSMSGAPVARAFTPTVGTVRPSARLGEVGVCTALPMLMALVKLAHISGSTPAASSEKEAVKNTVPTYDHDVRPQGLDGDGSAGNEPAATHRDDDGVHVVHLVEDLEAHGALARQDVGVVVAVDVLQPLLLADLESEQPALPDVGPVDDDVGSVLLTVLHLHDGRHDGHHHGDGDVHLAAVVGHRLQLALFSPCRQADIYLGMVAGRGGDYSSRLLLRGQHGQGEPEVD